MDLGQHHLYTCFCGAQFLYDLDINCTDNSPRDLWRELWRIREASKISYSQLFTTLLYSMYFPYTWTHASKKKSLPETRDPSGRLRFRKYSSHYARITCVALYRASGMLKNRSTENKTLMLNPHRACRDLRWEEKANPASPDLSKGLGFSTKKLQEGMRAECEDHLKWV